VEARRAALALCAAYEESDTTVSIQLSHDIRKIFAECDVDRISSQSLMQNLVKIDGGPWPEFKGHRPITPTEVARELTPFEIRPKLFRIGNEVLRGYEQSDFSDAFSRYLPPMKAGPSPLQPLQPLQTKERASELSMDGPDLSDGDIK
jgi:hypothetical protein